MIEVKDLSFTYPRAKDKTLRELNFSITRGEIFGFLGPSGAGKSTVQKILIGILKAYEGEVRVMGRQLADVKSDYYEDIGVAFEFPNFYNRFTAMENLSLFRSFYEGNTEDPRELLVCLLQGDENASEPVPRPA
ncbi:Fluoroquinolones export ATP-binding protein [compost metagenome]